MKDNNTYIKFDPNKIKIGYELYSNEKDGFVNCYIPGFDIAFSATSKEISKSRANSILTHFFDYYIKNQGWREFMLKIHKLGFRTEMHNFKMKELLNNRPIDAQFSPNENGEELFSEMFNKMGNVNSEISHAELAY